jgi:hypothetical protein
MFLSPIANSNRVPAGRLLQGCWTMLAEDGGQIRIGPDDGLVITHQQPLVKALQEQLRVNFALTPNLADSTLKATPQLAPASGKADTAGGLRTR